MLKIIYFDENSATDYLDIFNGGKSIKEKEEIKENKKELAEKVGLNLMAKFNWLFLSGQGNADLAGEFIQQKDSLLKTTISNTVLTDFIEKAAGDDRIEKFKNYSVYPPKNSLAFFKMFTPYLTMTNAVIPATDEMNIDVYKLDDALKNAKGYYEMLATCDGQEVVLRFNILSFRNSYSIADLPKMQLQYYAIKVGKTNPDQLDINKEFSGEYQNNNTIQSAFDLKNPNCKKTDTLDVFDVLLAGVNYE